LGVEAIDAAIARAHVGLGVKRVSQNELLFHRSSYLTFAFTCLRVTLSEKAGVILLTPYHDRVDLLRPGARQEAQVRRTLLTNELGLLDWDEPSDRAASVGG
jgi:hypothetical protein